MFQIFDAMKATYKFIELDNREDMDDIQDALEEITGARTVNILLWIDQYSFIHNDLSTIQVPRVFVNGKFIGGGSEVRKMSQSGKLQELLQ